MHVSEYLRNHISGKYDDESLIKKVHLEGIVLSDCSNKKICELL